uniref:Uncharacterized protein n=1 Tax=Anguilla anguilla TaxID=7936 RepID=A0A0E9UI23_ANGAN
MFTSDTCVFNSVEWTYCSICKCCTGMGMLVLVRSCGKCPHEK